MYWDLDSKWYTCVVKRYNPLTRRHFLVYDDRGVEWVDLGSQAVELLPARRSAQREVALTDPYALFAAPRTPFTPAASKAVARTAGAMAAAEAAADAAPAPTGEADGPSAADVAQLWTGAAEVSEAERQQQVVALAALMRRCWGCLANVDRDEEERYVRGARIGEKRDRERESGRGKIETEMRETGKESRRRMPAVG